MAQMKREQEHGKDVKARDERTLESVNHHRIDVVMIERVEGEGVKAGVGRANGEMEDVIDDEGEQNKSAQNHAARGEGGFDRVLAFVAGRSSCAVLNRQPDGVINMEKNHDEQPSANDPKEHSELAQIFGVTVDPFRAEEDLQIAKKMPDDEENEDHSGRRYDDFPANRRAVKGGDVGHKENAAGAADESPYEPTP